MSAYLEQSMILCGKLMNMFEEDHQKLHNHLQGEVYEEYRKLMEDEKNRVARLKTSIKRICD